MKRLPFEVEADGFGGACWGRTGDVVNFTSGSTIRNWYILSSRYAQGTHSVFPEGIRKTMLPVGSAFFAKWDFLAAGKYPKECRETRKDSEKRLCQGLAEWKGEM